MLQDADVVRSAVHVMHGEHVRPEKADVGEELGVGLAMTLGRRLPVSSNASTTAAVMFACVWTDMKSTSVVTPERMVSTQPCRAAIVASSRVR